VFGSWFGLCRGSKGKVEADCEGRSSRAFEGLREMGFEKVDCREEGCIFRLGWCLVRYGDWSAKYLNGFGRGKGEG